MKKSGIYTTTGDSGTTSLVGGKRVKKNDIRLEAYGTVDELNSNLGLLIAMGEGTLGESQVKFMRWVQSKLFNIGAYLATDASQGESPRCQGLDREDVAKVERQIDEVDVSLPPLRSFILPGGAEVAAMAHVARAVCRRCERRVIDLADVSYVDAEVTRFINRMSDYLFVIARLANINGHGEEIAWQP